MSVNQYSSSSSVFLITAGSRGNILMQVHQYNRGCSHQLTLGTFCMCLVVYNPKCSRYVPLP